MVDSERARDLEQMLAERTEERDELREVLSEVSAYLSVGSGDENTTAHQYRNRIMDGMKLHNQQAGTLISDLTTQLAAVTAERDALKTELEKVTELMGGLITHLKAMKGEQ